MSSTSSPSFSSLGTPYVKMGQRSARLVFPGYRLTNLERLGQPLNQWLQAVEGVLGQDGFHSFDQSAQRRLVWNVCGAGDPTFNLFHALVEKAAGILVAFEGDRSVRPSGFLIYGDGSTRILTINMICGAPEVVGYLVKAVESVAQQDYGLDFLYVESAPATIGFYRSVGFHQGFDLKEAPDITEAAQRFGTEHPEFLNLLVDHGLVARECLSIQACNLVGYAMIKCIHPRGCRPQVDRQAPVHSVESLLVAPTVETTEYPAGSRILIESVDRKVYDEKSWRGLFLDEKGDFSAAWSGLLTLADRDVVETIPTLTGFIRVVDRDRPLPYLGALLYRAGEMIYWQAPAPARRRMPGLLGTRPLSLWASPVDLSWLRHLGFRFANADTERLATLLPVENPRENNSIYYIQEWADLLMNLISTRQLRPHAHVQFDQRYLLRSFPLVLAS